MPNISAAELVERNHAATAFLKTLEAIESTLGRIVKLADEMPSDETFCELEKSLERISMTFESIPGLVENLTPSAQQNREAVGESEFFKRRLALLQKQVKEQESSGHSPAGALRPTETLPIRKS